MTGRVLANVTGVAIDGRAVLIEGSSGSGKSSLALALIDRGARLIGDDAVRIARNTERLIASPPPNTEGLLEVRGVGIIEFPTAEAPVALLLRLDPDSPRFPMEQENREIQGVAIPELPFAAGDAVQAIRAENALSRYGLRFDD